MRKKDFASRVWTSSRSQEDPAIVRSASSRRDWFARIRASIFVLHNGCFNTPVRNEPDYRDDAVKAARGVGLNKGYRNRNGIDQQR